MIRILSALLITAMTTLGCDQQSTPPPLPFDHPEAIITIWDSTGGGATCSVANNFQIGADGQTREYSGTLRSPMGGVEVRYRFVGTKPAPVDPAEGFLGDGDAYLIHLQLTNASEEEISAVYRGGRMVIVDRPEVRIAIHE